jgi:hypothetical protein
VSTHPHDDEPSGATVDIMMSLILASGATQILLATGAGAFAIVIGGIAVFATLSAGDRGKLGTLLRHPVRTIFTEDEPDPDDWD